MFFVGPPRMSCNFLINISLLTRNMGNWEASSSAPKVSSQFFPIFCLICSQKHFFLQNLKNHIVTHIFQVFSKVSKVLFFYQCTLTILSTEMHDGVTLTSSMTFMLYQNKLTYFFIQMFIFYFFAFHLKIAKQDMLAHLCSTLIYPYLVIWSYFCWFDGY